MKDFGLKMIFWFTLWVLIFVFGNLLDGKELSDFWIILVRTLGVIFIIFGIILNAVAGKSLKKWGHASIERKGFKAPDRVVNKGIYSCMRHPAQFGSGIISVGMGFLTGKIAGILLAGWGMALALIFMLNIEETETVGRFKEDYCNRMMRKPAISLNIMCIIKGIKALYSEK